MEIVATRSVLIAIPALNEENSVGQVVASVRASQPNAEIVVIDDGSTDKTALIARNAGAEVLSMPFNVGVGGAMRVAFLYALDIEADAVVQVDADGQHDPAQIDLLLAKLDEFEYQELLILDVESDLDAVLDRSLERWWVGRNDPSDDLGGRFVPTELIRNLFLPDGSTKCRANAEVMLALSDRMRTELRVSFTRSGMHTETVTTRGTGIEGAQFPSLGGPD